MMKKKIGLKEYEVQINFVVSAKTSRPVGRLMRKVVKSIDVKTIRPNFAVKYAHGKLRKVIW
jgi:hypothetical protein